MVKYFIDTLKGTIHLDNKESHSSDGDIKYQEIWLVKTKEFAEGKQKHPYQKNLLKSMDPIHCCKAEIFRDCILGTIKIPDKINAGTGSVDFGFYLRGNQIIFVENEGYLNKLMAKVMDFSYENCTLSQLLLIVLERLIEDDAMYLQEMEEEMTAIEEGLLVKLPEDFNQNIVTYRKKLFSLHTYYEQMMDLGDLMQSSIARQWTGEDGGAWRLYTNRAERLHNHVEKLRDYLGQIRGLYQSLLGVQQNSVMTFLTVVTTIFLPLTLIAGWYGMNFSNMPEFKWEYGYLGVVVISVSIILLEVIYFKKKKML